MDRKQMRNYKTNEREIALIDTALDRLQERLAEVPVISGKVTKSGDDFPYIEEHVTVQMQEPREATSIKDEIRKKKMRKEILYEEMQEVEKFIRELPEGIDKRIFELTYLEGKRQWEVADEVGYSRGRVTQIIGSYLQD